MLVYEIFRTLWLQCCKVTNFRTVLISYFSTDWNFFFFCLRTCQPKLKAGPPWFEFLVIFDFLHHNIAKVERHFLWKFHWKIQRKGWSNAPPKLLACIRFPYKVVHKNGRLQKFSRAREIEFNFFIAWTIFMKLGTLVHHPHGYQICLRFCNFCLGT